MPIEIERKFLITSGSWKQYVDKSVVYRQGYIMASIVHIEECLPTKMQK